MLRPRTLLQVIFRYMSRTQVPGAAVVWCQEEPKNMGPWNYVRLAPHTLPVHTQSLLSLIQLTTFLIVYLCRPRMDTAMREMGGSNSLRALRLCYVGRPAAASPGGETAAPLRGQAAWLARRCCVPARWCSVPPSCSGDQLPPAEVGIRAANCRCTAGVPNIHARATA